VTAYTVSLRPKARQALTRLDGPARKAVAQLIDSLADDPRPPGTKPLRGHRPYLRVRSGDYRVIYAVDDAARTLRVVVVGHRREVYRGLDL
jgi:mRNA interferase RelE/StbE